MASASDVAGLLALVGAGVGTGYFLFRYRKEISEKMESLKSEKRRLRRRITELDSDDKDAINQSEIETTDWRT